eukprot:CAMPEP_0197603570 /NCGR_PEP_ID=MMETSP1326-20131121/39468_1 /TAXON_ID=1155430 /ORGANISM="Genus nov. species nov., Strain RCC2288" /LENGTH=324 /DNA_ID=CAMNT_0043171095 /DNA_START=50 /DNA_END=1024 /DNA_ORIENTATION=-
MPGAAAGVQQRGGATPTRAASHKNVAGGNVAMKLKSHGHQRTRRAAAMPPTRAMSGWAKFTAAVRREVDLTFNPRTNGAKIAGRCPDTQTLPNEIQRQRDMRYLLDGGDPDSSPEDDFSVRSFTAALEAQVAESRATGPAPSADDAIAASLANRLAQVNDADSMKARSEEKQPEPLVWVGTMSERQRELELDYYGEDFVSEGSITGRELALMVFSKYGKYHDMAIKQARMSEDSPRWVSLNLYVGHLGQRSYPSTEEIYLAQMDSIAYMISSWGQADYARAFFREKPTAKRGLPGRPQVDTCVTLQFSRSPTWDDAMGDELFNF